MADLLAMAQAAIGSVKSAKLKSLDSGSDTFELQFNPERDSLRLSRRVDWSFPGGKAAPTDAWGGPARFDGTREDRLSFTTLLDDSTGGKVAWAAAAAKSALAVGLLAATDPTSDLITSTRLQVMAGGDLVTGALDSVAEAALRTIESTGLKRSKITKDIEKLYFLTTPDQQTGAKMRSSIVRFEWGDFDFTGVITSLDVRYLLFSEPGYPKRARVEIDLAGRAFGKIEDADTFLEPGAWSRPMSLL